MYSLSRLFRGVLCSAATEEGKREVCIVLQSGGALGFSVSLFWLFWIGFSVFVPKTSIFYVLLFISICGLYAVKHLVFGFRQKHKRVLEFFRFDFDLGGNSAPPLISNNRETQMLLRGICDKPNVTEIIGNCPKTSLLPTMFSIVSFCSDFSSLSGNTAKLSLSACWRFKFVHELNVFCSLGHIVKDFTTV